MRMRPRQRSDGRRRARCSSGAAPRASPHPAVLEWVEEDGAGTTVPWSHSLFDCMALLRSRTGAAFAYIVSAASTCDARIREGWEVGASGPTPHLPFPLLHVIKCVYCHAHSFLPAGSSVVIGLAPHHRGRVSWHKLEPLGRHTPAGVD